MLEFWWSRDSDNVIFFKKNFSGRKGNGVFEGKELGDIHPRSVPGPRPGVMNHGIMTIGQETTIFLKLRWGYFFQTLLLPIWWLWWGRKLCLEEEKVNIYHPWGCSKDGVLSVIWYGDLDCSLLYDLGICSSLKSVILCLGCYWDKIWLGTN